MAKHIVVIGGGLSGTSAAYALTKRGYNVTILEKNDYIGGRIHTHTVEGAAVEMGAGFMTRIYSNVLTFLHNESLDTRLYRQYGSSGILRNRQIQMATVPTLLGNKALSWKAKLHIIPLLAKTLARWPHLDHHAFWRGDRYDKRSVADLIGKSNEELLEYLLQPALNAYFYWTPEHVSEAMLFGLSKAVLTQGNEYKMRGGLQQIPEKAAESSTVLLGREVKQVQQNKKGLYDVIVEHNGKTETLQAEGIVCATTATVVPRIFTDMNEVQKTFFQSVEYSSTAVVARFFTPEHIHGSKGLAFPRREGIELASVTAEYVTDELATIKTFASGTIGSQLCKESDRTIVDRLVLAMVPARDAVLIGDPEPTAIHTQRWPEALPFFDVGHFKRLRAFEDGEIENPDQAIVFAGDYLSGPFMEGAFTSGMQAASRLDALLQK